MLNQEQVRVKTTKIDFLTVNGTGRPSRFSGNQLDELLTLARKHNCQNSDTVTDLFFALQFTSDADADAFIAEVAEWSKSAHEIEPPRPKQLCGNCAHFERCKRLIQCSPQSESCDWIPSRFQEVKHVANSAATIEAGVPKAR